jgi:hypothetical protein
MQIYSEKKDNYQNNIQLITETDKAVLYHPHYSKFMTEIMVKWNQIYTKGIALSASTNMNTCTFCR